MRDTYNSHTSVSHAEANTFLGTHSSPDIATPSSLVCLCDLRESVCGSSTALLAHLFDKLIFVLLFFTIRGCAGTDNMTRVREKLLKSSCNPWFTLAERTFYECGLPTICGNSTLITSRSVGISTPDTCYSCYSL